jgi:hypothetical protein
MSMCRYGQGLYVSSEHYAMIAFDIPDSVWSHITCPVILLVWVGMSYKMHRDNISMLDSIRRELRYLCRSPEADQRHHHHDDDSTAHRPPDQSGRQA